MDAAHSPPKIGAVSPSGGASQSDPDGAPALEGTVDTPARPLHKALAFYPTGARVAGVEGDVGLEVIVGTSGAVESARVVHPVGYGLDEAAAAALRGFVFSPAIKGGRPVRVRMFYSFAFRHE